MSRKANRSIRTTQNRSGRRKPSEEFDSGFVAQVEPQVKKSFTLKDLKTLKPMTQAQHDTFYEWFDGDKDGYHNDVVGMFGCAGTGKSLVACYLALQLVLDQDTPYDKLVIIRSAVPSRDIGFLPGEENQKIDPYKAPYRYLFDKLFQWKKSFDNMEAIGLVQFEITSFLRGTTFENAVVVIDECQDTTEVEFETVLTRLGNNARMFVVGDLVQNDLGSKSGFNAVVPILRKTPGTAIVEFGVDDIVRSGFVKEYLKTKYRM